MKRWMMLAGLLLLAACEDGTHIAIRMRPRFAPIRARLAKLAGELPTLRAPAKAALAPQLVIDATDYTGNAELFAAENLTDLKAKPALDLPFTGDRLLGALRDTSEDPSLSYHTGRPGRHYQEHLDAALALRYLVVYRATRNQGWSPVRKDGRDLFTAAEMDADVYVLDLRSGEVRAQLSIASRLPEIAAPSVVGPEWNQLVDRQFAQIRRQLALDLQDKLAAATGGSVRLVKER